MIVLMAVATTIVAGEVQPLLLRPEALEFRTEPADLTLVQVYRERRMAGATKVTP